MSTAQRRELRTIELAESKLRRAFILKATACAETRELLQFSMDANTADENLEILAYVTRARKLRTRRKALQAA